MKRIIIFIIAVLTMATVQGQTLTKKQKGLAACAFPIGEPNVNYAQYFIGDSFVAPIKAANLAEADATVMPIVNKCITN